MDKSIIEQNIRSGLRVIVIYLLNLRVMDNKTKPSNIYTMVANEQLEGDEPRIEKFATTNLHIYMTRVQN